jgi:heme A synthase
MCCLFWIAGMVTAIAAMMAAVIAWFAAPYLFLAGLCIWLMFHLVFLGGLLGLLFCISGGAKIMPTRATQIVAGLSILTMVIGWNIYTPTSPENQEKPAGTVAVISPTLTTLEATPTPTPEASPTPAITPETSPASTPESSPTPTPLNKHSRRVNRGHRSN